MLFLKVIFKIGLAEVFEREMGDESGLWFSDRGADADRDRIRESSIVDRKVDNRNIRSGKELRDL